MLLVTNLVDFITNYRFLLSPSATSDIFVEQRDLIISVPKCNASSIASTNARHPAAVVDFRTRLVLFSSAVQNNGQHLTLFPLIDII